MASASSGLPDDHKYPRLEVFGARRVGGGPKAEFDQSLIHRLVGELPTGTLPEDDVEEGL